MRGLALLLIGLAALACAGSAGARDQSDGPPGNYSGYLAQVQWAQAPSYAQVVAAYPARARQRRLGGRALLTCELTEDGQLSRCDLDGANPSGYGFGAAARSLARDFVAAQRGQDGEYYLLTGAYTQILFTFSPAMLADPAPVIGDPKWIHVPQRLDAAESFPAAAVAAHVATGHVALACTVAQAGRLTDCSVSREEPAGLGFGDAALQLSRDFQVSLWTAKGLPTVGGRVTVPIRYQAPEPAAADEP